MHTVLSITIPFFVIIFLGTLFRAKNIFDDNASKTLTRFAFFVTLPPFIFLNIVKSSNNNIFQWDFIVRFEIITILIFLSCKNLRKYFVLSFFSALIVITIISHFNPKIKQRMFDHHVELLGFKKGNVVIFFILC